MEGGLESYQGRLGAIQKGFAEVAQGITLLDELMRELKATKALLTKTQLDLESESETRRRLQQEIHNEKGLVERRGRRPFVVALIDADADCYVFRDQFLSQGERGGEKAADALLKALFQVVRDLPTPLTDVSILVKAFANVDGLGSALQRDGRLAHKDVLRSFVVGFNSRKTLFNFVDVGSGKERADTKLKESIKFYLDSFQCKHLVLACGHDDGYAPWLGQFLGDSQVAKRISLVEGHPFPAKMRQLGLQRVRLSSVFNDGTYQSPLPVPVLVPVRVPSSLVINRVANDKGSNGTSEQSTAKKKSSWVPPAGTNESAQRHRLAPVLTDENGRRVDKVLQVQKNASDVVRKARLCSYYYLRGKCATKCQRNHDFRPLTDEEFDALWELSRHGQCDKSKTSARVGGPDCCDPMCVYGHGIGRVRGMQAGNKKYAQSRSGSVAGDSCMHAAS